MFLRSSNITSLVQLLSYARVSGIWEMASCNRKWEYTSNPPQTTTQKSIRISAVMMLDAKNVSIAVEISLLSRIQAEIYVIPFPLPLQAAMINYSTWRRRLFALALPCFWTAKMAVSPAWKFADISFVSWVSSHIRSVHRHFDCEWAWLIYFYDT